MTDSGIIGIGNRAPRKGEKRAVIMAKQLGDVNKKLDVCEDDNERKKLTVEVNTLSTGLQGVDKAYF